MAIEGIEINKIKTFVGLTDCLDYKVLSLEHGHTECVLRAGGKIFVFYDAEGTVVRYSSEDGAYIEFTDLRAAEEYLRGSSSYVGETMLVRRLGAMLRCLPGTVFCKYFLGTKESFKGVVLFPNRDVEAEFEVTIRSFEFSAKNKGAVVFESDDIDEIYRYCHI